MTAIERNELYERILQLRSEGMNTSVIAEKLNEEGRTTPRGLKINSNWVYTFLRDEGRRRSKKVSPRKPRMETLQIPLEPENAPTPKPTGSTTTGKMVVMVADAEQVREFLKGWLHGN